MMHWVQNAKSDITNWRVGHLYCNIRGVTTRNHGSDPV